MIIDRFADEYRFLSNFYDKTPVRWTHPLGETWVCRSAEHLYQAHKTTDLALAYAIAADPDLSPMGAKRAGRRLKLRSDWGAVRLEVMRNVLAAKFADDTELAARLLGTGSAMLIEGNHWGDTFWGVSGGHGQNWLGYLLMARRAELRAQEPPMREMEVLGHLSNVQVVGAVQTLKAAGVSSGVSFDRLMEQYRMTENRL